MFKSLSRVLPIIGLLWLAQTPGYAEVEEGVEIAMWNGFGHTCHILKDSPSYINVVKSDGWHVSAFYATPSDLGFQNWDSIIDLSRKADMILSPTSYFSIDELPASYKDKNIQDAVNEYLEDYNFVEWAIANVG